ncbi:hypothetical protein PIROE2DRAFT_11425 [Piromyces sp. E2]|nr:hypothetical protein PIROE2DRAFT_11425 [Piromyces sp. E2]|eukprot:OUM62324.1 hypothetical protein PIROE2DRAFT_11425 [Piromyces sp. E2]
MTSYDVPANHFDDTNAFKEKDTDVERFLTMCEKHISYFFNFYSSEKKRVKFIEAYLGPASEWYFTFLGKRQKENPDSQLLLDEWGNAVEFVTRFKLYATQLQIPEILLQFFEDRVHPLVRRKLMDLEPQRRNIENYSQILISYDNEKDRHWNLENKKNNSSDELKTNKNKKHKLFNNIKLKFIL